MPASQDRDAVASPEPQTADMAAEHISAISSPDEFGGRVEMAHAEIAIDDHHAIVRPLKRGQKEIRGFDHRVIVCPSSNPDARLEPTEARPHGGEPSDGNDRGGRVLKGLFKPIPPGGRRSSLRIRYHQLKSGNESPAQDCKACPRGPAIGRASAHSINFARRKGRLCKAFRSQRGHRRGPGSA